jgi:hypothetical protein
VVAVLEAVNNECDADYMETVRRAWIAAGRPGLSREGEKK